MWGFTRKQRGEELRERDRTLLWEGLVELGRQMDAAAALRRGLPGGAENQLAQSCAGISKRCGELREILKDARAVVIVKP